MKNIIKVSAFIALFSLSITATASEMNNNNHISLKASTMGIGLDYERQINQKLSVSLGFVNQSLNKTTTEGGISYAGDVSFDNMSVIANFEPWSNGFRFRAGAYRNNNSISLSANSTVGDLTVGNTKLTNATVSLGGKLSFRKFSPYVGIGYSSKPIFDSNFSLDFDAGLINSPVTVELIGTCAVGTGTATICDTFEADIAKENTDLKNAVDLDIFPVVSVSLSYRF